MSTTMHAAQVAARKTPLELVEKDVPEPGDRAVLVKVEACGVCHSDSLVVEGTWPGIRYPRTPGHEVAGTVHALGPNAEPWRVGDRVGVGWHGGHCGRCDRCRRGDFITCRVLAVPGIAYDGGYAEYIVAPAVALARIPDALSAAEAAPLLCAGITTFNALRHSGAGPGDLVAILGIGGLGHLGVQFAAKMGFETVAIARGAEKEPLARELGAHHYIDSDAADVAKTLKALGGARVVLATATSAAAMGAAVGGLGIDGQLLIVGVTTEPLALNTLAMLGSRQSVRGWPSGTSADSEDTMRFSALTGVRARIETMPLARAAEAYARMMSNAARFRMVLTT
jgi:D-arabinose 1-dehydrogenase-like Zn-dependent alcohol dehydrogenase